MFAALRPDAPLGFDAEFVHPVAENAAGGAEMLSRAGLDAVAFFQGLENQAAFEIAYSFFQVERGFGAGVLIRILHSCSSNPGRMIETVVPAELVSISIVPL